jgi:hypothetical protein
MKAKILVRPAAAGSCGYAVTEDAGKNQGQNTHILVDTLDLLLHAIVHPADVQDRDGGVRLASTLAGVPTLAKLFADGGHQGARFRKGLANFLLGLAIDIADVPTAPKVCSPSTSLSNARSLGSIAIDGWPRIGRTSAARRSFSRDSHPSASCFESFMIPHSIS